MICSTCGKDVVKYYRGHQCTECFRKPQTRWRKRNRDKENMLAQARYTKDPQKHSACVRASKAKRVDHYRVMIRLRDKFDSRYLKDSYVKKRIRESCGNKAHIITEQEINEKRQQIAKFRVAKQRRKDGKAVITPRKLTLFCSLVSRAIPAETCRNMQMNYKYEACSICEYRTKRVANGVG